MDDMAETELRVFARQCMNRRIEHFSAMKRDVSALARESNKNSNDKLATHVIRFANQAQASSSFIVMIVSRVMITSAFSEQKSSCCVVSLDDKFDDDGANQACGRSCNEEQPDIGDADFCQSYSRCGSEEDMEKVDRV
jgi:hypothetical protein